MKWDELDDGLPLGKMAGIAVFIVILQIVLVLGVLGGAVWVVLALLKAFKVIH